MALGVLGLTPEVYGNMVPAELNAAIRGYYWKEEKKTKHSAWMLAQIINACGQLKKGKTVRTHDFYKPSHMDWDNEFFRNFIGN